MPTFASTQLHLGPTAVVELTGLRTPCVQMNRLQPGLMAASFTTHPDNRRTPRAGVMGIVLLGGPVKSGDPIELERPASPHRPLQPV